MELCTALSGLVNEAARAATALFAEPGSSFEALTVGT